jgi:hypothetical protein
MIAAAAFLFAAAPALAPAPQSPVELFKAACTGGSVSLPRGSAAPIAFGKLPYAARAALGQTLAAPGQSMLPGAPKPEEVPGPVLAIGPGEALFLIAPAPDEKARGRFAHACAIAWKGEHYDEGRQAILPGVSAAMPALETPRSNPLGLAFVGTLSGDLYLSVTTLRDWTILKSVPRAEASISGER